MLTKIVVKNYALIEELTLQPDKGLNIITGETGAGKSILLGALGLLLGQRADAKVITEGEEKCIIEGTFQIEAYQLNATFEALELEYDAETIIRREISKSGKSRLFINDSPATLEQAKELGQYLIDIHSQHDSLQLGSAVYQLDLIDKFAGLGQVLEAYQALFDRYSEKKNHLRTLLHSEAADKKQLDFLQFQLDEFDKLGLEPNELEVLEEEQNQLEHAEEIKQKIATIVDVFRENELAIEPRLKQTINLLQRLSDFGAPYTEYLERSQSAFLELKDIADSLEAKNEEIFLDENRLIQVQERLSNIFRLMKKHNVRQYEELLQVREETQQKIKEITSYEDVVSDLQSEVDKLEAQVVKAARDLSAKRQPAIKAFEKEITEKVRELGIPKAQVVCEQSTLTLSKTGIDQVSILFSANQGIRPAPLKSIASGGEFSRLMLVVKHVLAKKTALPTLIFDEIDTGISGEVARKVGRMMQEMAKNHQILSITHLPQIASLGSAHFYVYKQQKSQKTVSHIKLLTEKERLEEIAVMMSGYNPSAAALQAARELLEAQ